MRLRHVLVALGWVAGAVVLAQCGSSASTPTSSPTSVVVQPTPIPTPAGIVLPAGMVCNPTPPPMLRMKVGALHERAEGGGMILDSKPVVPNVDHYCERVGFGDWKFCDTRPEGDPQRVACDYLAVGQAENGRWGPTWVGEGKPCGAEFSQCAMHPSNQFLTIAKGNGEFKACASDLAPVADNGDRCGLLEFY